MLAGMLRPLLRVFPAHGINVLQGLKGMRIASSSASELFSVSAVNPRIVQLDSKCRRVPQRLLHWPDSFPKPIEIPVRLR